MQATLVKQVRRRRRKIGIRKRVIGTAERPRLTVYRSLKHVYAQVIDDIAGKTLVAAGSRQVTLPPEAPTSAVAADEPAAEAPAAGGAAPAPPEIEAAPSPEGEAKGKGKGGAGKDKGAKGGKGGKGEAPAAARKAAKGPKPARPLSGKRRIAAAVGAELAAKARAAGVTQVAFDRNGFKYHGRLKALADAARAGGLKF